MDAIIGDLQQVAVRMKNARMVPAYANAPANVHLEIGAARELRDFNFAAIKIRMGVMNGTPGNVPAARNAKMAVFVPSLALMNAA